MKTTRQRGWDAAVNGGEVTTQISLQGSFVQISLGLDCSTSGDTNDFFPSNVRRASFPWEFHLLSERKGEIRAPFLHLLFFKQL